MPFVYRWRALWDIVLLPFWCWNRNVPVKINQFNGCWFPHRLRLQDTSCYGYSCVKYISTSLIARFMWPTWGPSGADRTRVGSLLAPWILLSGKFIHREGLTVCTCAISIAKKVFTELNWSKPSSACWSLALYAIIQTLFFLVIKLRFIYCGAETAEVFILADNVLINCGEYNVWVAINPSMPEAEMLLKN